jgi:nitrate reductase NapE component
MESRRTRVTLPGAGDARQRTFKRMLPLALVGMALTAVAVVGDGGVTRAHYLRQLVFGPAAPHIVRPAAPSVPVIPAREAERP